MKRSGVHPLLKDDDEEEGDWGMRLELRGIKRE